MLESGEAASAEEITQCSAVEEEPAYGRYEVGTVGTDSRLLDVRDGRNTAVSSVRKPVRMPSNRMEHDQITVANDTKCWTKRFHPEWLRSRIAEYSRLAYSKRR